MEKDNFDYSNAWNLLKQMIEYYTFEKKYLTKKEINYIIRFCENKNKNIISIKIKDK